MSKGKKGKGRKKRAAQQPKNRRAEPAPGESLKPAEQTEAPAPTREAAAEPTPQPATALPLPFFGRPDWLAFGATSLVTFIVYFFTLAPNVTLEDAGELATASMYAGVPHAPGYPLWTVYSWLFTVLLPVGNIAWRVMVSSAVAASLACGLVALMASRGGRMMLANMDWFGDLEERWQKAIGGVSGFAGATIFGFTGFMWSQAVIVEVYTLSTLTFTGVFACLMRWWYVPEKRWPLYLAYFLFGLCLANHQTLLLAAVGIELLIFLRQREVGRDFFLCNSFIYLAGLIYMASSGALADDGAVLQATRVGAAAKILLFAVYNLVGIGSVLLTIWHTLPATGDKPQWRAAGFLGAAFALAFTLLAFIWVVLMSRIEMPLFQQPEIMEGIAASGKYIWNLGTAWAMAFTTTSRILFWFCIFLALGAVGALLWLAIKADRRSVRTILCAGYLFVFLGIAGLWTVQLLTARHQVAPAAQLAQTNALAAQAQTVPNFASAITAAMQKQAADFLPIAKARVDSANGLSYWFVLLNLPFLGGILIHSWLRTGWREGVLSSWRPLLGTRLATLAGVACYLYMPLTSMTNPPMNWAYPRTADNLKYAIVRGQYDNPSKEASDSFSKLAWDWDQNGIADGGQIGVFIDETIQEFNPAFLLLALLPFAFLRRMRGLEFRWLAGLGIVFVSMTILMIAFRNISGGESNRHLNKVFFEAPHLFIGLGVGLGLAIVLGLIASQWDRWRIKLLQGAGVLLALELLWWPPTQTAISATPASVLFTFTQYDAGVLRAAALVGALLLGGFCLLLAISRRGPLIWFLALCCLLPLRHGLANWWDNELRGHQFGYWYGHDMFKPPFTDDEGKPLYPPMEKGAILYGGTDAGRFNPTYFIFCESQVAPRHRTDPEFDRRDVYIITQNAAVEGQYMQYIRAHYCRSRQPDSPLLYSALVPREPDEEYGKKFIAPTQQAMRKMETLQAEIQQSLGAVASRLGNKLKVLGQSFPKDIPEQQLGSVMTKIIANLKDKPGEQQEVQKLWDTFSQLNQQRDLVVTNLIILMDQLQSLQSAHTLLSSVSWANRVLAPVDDWLTLRGRRVEKARRAGNSLFTPTDFTNLPALALKLKAGADPVSAFLRDQLSDETRGLLDQPDASALPARLADDLNRVIESEWTRQMEQYTLLRQLARRELTLLNNSFAERLPNPAVDPNAVLSLQMALREIQGREGKLARLLAFAKPPAPGNASAESIRSEIRFHEQQLLEHYEAAKGFLQNDHAQLAALMAERARVLKTIATPNLYDPGRFAAVALSPDTAYLLQQDPFTEARICLNRRLLEDAFPALLQHSQQGVYPGLEIDLPDHAQHQEAIGKALENKALSQQDKIWAANAEITRHIFNRNPNHAFYLEESVPMNWMNPYLAPYGIIMKLEAHAEIINIRTVSGHNGTGFKNGDALTLVFPPRLDLPAPTRPARLEVSKVDANGSIVSVKVKDRGQYLKLPPQPVQVTNSNGGTAQVTYQYQRTPTWPDALPLEVIKRDREFWRQYADRLIGRDIVQPETTVEEIRDWIRRVYIRRNHSGHTAEQRRFLRDYVAQRNFATLRLSVARVYLWRADVLERKINRLGKDSESAKPLVTARQALVDGADLALRQALAFGAVHPVASANLLEFLLNHDRIEEAGMVATLAYEMDPGENNLSHLQRLLKISAYRLFKQSQPELGHQLVEVIRETDGHFLKVNPGLENCQRMHLNLAGKRYEAITSFLTTARKDRKLDIGTITIFVGILRHHLLAAHDRNAKLEIAALRNLYELIAPGFVDQDPKLASVQARNSLPLLEAKHKQFPSDITNSINLLLTYNALKKTNDSLRIAKELMNAKPSVPRALAAAALAFDSAGDLPGKEAAQMKLIELRPNMPAAWFDLAVTRNRLKKTNESLAALKHAWTLAGSTNATLDWLDIRQLIRTTNVLDNLRPLPGFQSILEANATRPGANATTPP